LLQLLLYRRGTEIRGWEYAVEPHLRDSGTRFNDMHGIDSTQPWFKMSSCTELGMLWMMSADKMRRRAIFLFSTFVSSW
jgi:hypothetical protein